VPHLNAALRFSGRFVAVLGVALAMVGCTATAPGTPEPPAQPSGDFGTNMVACLMAKGWDVRTTGDGGFAPPAAIPAAQYERWLAEVDACRERFGYNDVTVTPAMASSFYDKLVASAECLRGLGYGVSQPPSRQAFVEQFAHGEIPGWAPYVELAAMLGGPGPEFAAVERACPQPTSW
jgi:hypothetical protein